MPTGSRRSRPDGDSVLDDTAGFRLCGCTECGGPLKPDVVFFGENVPKDRVARCIARVDAADAYWSSVRRSGHERASLRTSGRPRRKADSHREPWSTRGDDLATYRVNGGCSPVLESLARTLTSHPTLRSSEV